MLMISLYILQQAQLEVCYLEASQELDDDFDITTADGLENDEAW